MRQLPYPLLTTIAILGVFFIQTVEPVFAQEAASGKHLFNEVNHFQNQASHAAQTQQTDLQSIIKKADTLITSRISSLNTLSTRIQNDKRLSASEKNSLSSDIQTDMSGLTALKTKIDADTDATTARNDAKQIITNYYIYAVFEPKLRLLVTINNLQTATSNIQALIPHLQSLINTYKSQGKDVTQLQTLLNDISSQLQTINTTLTKDTTTVQGISVSSKSTAQTTFTQVRQDLAQIVRTDLAKIRSDFAQMRPLFKQIIVTKQVTSSPSHTVTTSSPTETEITTSPSASQ